MFVIERGEFAAVMRFRYAVLHSVVDAASGIAYPLAMASAPVVELYVRPVPVTESAARARAFVKYKLVVPSASASVVSWVSHASAEEVLNELARRYAAS